MTELGFDRVGTVRVTDEDGRMFIARTHISKAAINPYYGREIPNARELGLDEDRVYQLLRDPAELALAADTFNNLPLLLDHVHVTADTPRPEIVVGSTGTDASFSDPYLDNSLSVWSADAIAKINSGEQRELSCAYRYLPVMEAGEYQGQAYDGRMTQIRGNHVALVAAGRAGPDVLVADQKPIVGEIVMAKRGFAARVLAAVASGKLAMDASEEEVKKACMDDDLDDPDAASDEDKDEKKDEKPEGAKDEAEKKAEGNEEPDEKKKGAEDDGEKTDSFSTKNRNQKGEFSSGANDAAIQRVVSAAVSAERKRARLAEDARADVRSLVGDVLGMDSAEDIYRYALRERGVDTAGINLAGLRALVTVQKQATAPTRPSIAADSAASVATRFGATAPRKL